MSLYGNLHVVQALHGDCFVLEYDNKGDSGFMLIDGGPGKTYKRGTVQHRTTENLLQLLSDLSTGNSERKGSRLLKSVDTVVVTHDDEDHKNGIADLFRYLLKDKNCPLGTWQAGLDLMNGGSPPPIQKIWYNSQMNVIKQFLVRASKKHHKKLDPLKNTKGWFDSLLDTYKQECKLDLEFSQEFKDFRKHWGVSPGDRPKSTTDVNLVYAGAAAGVNTVKRGQFSFTILGPFYNEGLMKVKLIYELINASEYEEQRVSDEEITSQPDRGSGFPGTAKSASMDSSLKNRSSIAFRLTDNLKTDTKLLMLGDAALASKIEHGDYTIMKIAHHGSSHNNYLWKPMPLTDREWGIEVSADLLKKTVRFFYSVRAKVYVISASPTEGCPNPHITTILGIYIATVALRKKDEKRPPVAVYLTNKPPANTLRAIGAFLRDPGGVISSPGKPVLGPKNDPKIIDRLKDFDKHMRMWCLKPDTPYESIPIYDRKDIGDPDPDDPSNPNNPSKWIRCTKDYLLSKAPLPKRFATAATVHAKVALKVGGAKIPKKP